MELAINGKKYSVRADPATPLLWVLRDELGLTGTKFGCGKAQCGVCTVLVADQPVYACITPVRQVAGRPILTIEGLAQDADHPVRRAWLAEDVPQCGYCQAGQIMTAVALLRQSPRPDVAEIRRFMSRVLCRCGTYQRVLQAVQRAARAATGVDRGADR